MTIDSRWLESHVDWFLGKHNAEKAKHEILALFSDEPADGVEWTLQDICEQSGRIIRKWDQMSK